jgi:hypothetical protein
MPDEISEADGYIVQNKTYDRPLRRGGRHAFMPRSPNAIHRVLVPSNDLPGVGAGLCVVVPFVLKESNIWCVLLGIILPSGNSHTE